MSNIPPIEPPPAVPPQATQPAVVPPPAVSVPPSIPQPPPARYEAPPVPQAPVAAEPPRPNPYAASAPAYQPPPTYQAPPTYQQPPPGYAQQTYAQPGYPQQPTAYAPYNYQAGPVLPKGLAITAMILGIVSVVASGWGLVVGIAAVIIGHIAQRRQPYAKAFWITGLITGYIGIGIGLLVTAFLVFTVIAGIAGDYNSY